MNADSGAPQGAQPLVVHATLAAPAEEGALDPLIALRFLARHAVMIIAAAVLVGAATFGTSYLLARTWRSEVLLEPTSNDEADALSGLASKFGGIAGVLGVDVGGAGRSTAASLAVLQSRQLVAGFITENNLIPVLFAKRWDAEHQRWRVTGSKIPTLDDAYELFSRDVLSTREDRKSGLVVIGIEWRDPRVAAVWANSLVLKANRYMAQQAAVEADRNLEYLNTELAKTDEVGLRQAINSLIETEIKKRMLARTRVDYAFRVLDPAVPAQMKRHVKPRRILFLLGGAFLGATLGVLAGLLLEWRARRRPGNN